MHADFLSLSNPITPEVLQVLNYFCRDTTERILINLARLRTHNTGTLARSIHSTVYNNAAGNDAMIRFYYMNYGSYIEHALGRYITVDDDLKEALGRKGGKAVGVRRKNVDVPAITGSNFDTIRPSLTGIPDKINTEGKYHGRSRSAIHQAKPAINSEIRLHLRGTTERLAKTLAFTATAYVLRGMVMGMTQARQLDNTGRSTHDSKVLSGQDNAMDRGYKVDNYGYEFNFVPDMTGEEAWLATRGYLKQIQYGWRLSSVGREILAM